MVAIDSGARATEQDSYMHVEPSIVVGFLILLCAAVVAIVLATGH